MTITGTATDAAAAWSAASRCRSTAARPGTRRRDATSWTLQLDAASDRPGDDPHPRRRRQRQPRVAGRRRRPSTSAPRDLPVHDLGRLASRRPPTENDTEAVELGVKFRADVDGFITGDPLLQGRGTPAPTSATCGHRRARCSPTATFTGETRVRLAGGRRSTSPVAITADTTYVVSYHTPNGHYAVDAQLLRRAAASTTRRCTRSPTASTAPTASTGTAPAASSRPRPSTRRNYWVDVVFDDDVGPDTTPPHGQRCVAGRRRAPASPRAPT